MYWRHPSQEELEDTYELTIGAGVGLIIKVEVVASEADNWK